MVLRVDTRSRACLYAMSEQLISLFSVHDVALRIHAHLALKGLACIRMTSEKGIVRSLVYCARRLTQSNRKIGIFSRSPSYIHHYWQSPFIIIIITRRAKKSIFVVLGTKYNYLTKAIEHQSFP